MRLNRFQTVCSPGLTVWCLVGLIAICTIYISREVTWLTNYPDQWVVPLAQWANLAMDWFVAHFRWLFRSISWLLSWPMEGVVGLLTGLPWPATIILFLGITLVIGSWRLMLFTASALLYMVVVGYWIESMRTLALVAVSVPLSIGTGFALGVMAWRSTRTNKLVQPMLDLMQTVPTFAYLIPILLLFGFGPVVGLIASAIYACPPMVRNTLLALQRVPNEIVESGEMAGTTPRQLFWWIRFPSALPTIMIGINQTTMAALSMVIIAAIIGSSADIGWEVLSTMRRANFGESLLAGIVVALIAMLLDRITRSLTVRGTEYRRWWLGLSSWSVVSLTIFVALVIVAASVFFPGLNTYPDKWIIYPVTSINNAITFVTVEFSVPLEKIKNTTLFFFLLPIRIGLENTIRPFTWGFELTPIITLGYAAIGVVLALVLGVRHTWRACVGTLLVLTLLFFGLENLPWPLLIIVLVVFSWQVGGRRVGLLTLFGLSFMVVTGVWPLAMRSLYLCFAAVLVSFIVGSSLGIWASQNDRVSRVLRPINDTLQTMPLFVLLIPVLMFFQVGEFTAFLAIIAYAIVPAIRYTEHGLRHVDSAVIEAAQAMGCKAHQLLWQIRLPLAIPEIMLGLNQTIMFALAMLVIAALVGTQGLGQAVYIALGQANFGQGLVAGLSMALIAIIADRMLQAFSRGRKAALGLD